MSKRQKIFLLQDLIIIFFSIIIAILLVKTGVLMDLLASTRELEFFGSFIAGIFFTSAFTTAPAIVGLGEIARVDSILVTAVLGSLGAVIGDLVIFRFFKDRFSEHLSELLKHQGAGKRVRAFFRLRLFRWFAFVIGVLIIASPFPDELGISLLGFSKMKTAWFIPISLISNFIGILAIGLVARAL